jgi:hypothetical protein
VVARKEGRHGGATPTLNIVEIKLNHYQKGLDLDLVFRYTWNHLIHKNFYKEDEHGSDHREYCRS